MTWTEFDKNAFIDDGVVDKGTICMNTIVSDCKQMDIVVPTLEIFLSLLQRTVFVSCGKSFIDFQGKMTVFLVKAGFMDDPEIFATDAVPDEYLFIDNILCKAFGEIEQGYLKQFNRKPFLQEIFAIFSFVVCARPDYYFSNIGTRNLIYVNLKE